jgi:hypothetical protein
MKYTEKDLQVFSDPLEFIRQQPERFLFRVCGDELAEHLVGDASILTNRPVTLLRQDCWWIIAGEQDWLTTSPWATEEELFTRIVPFPEAGANSMRAEVLLAAFATDIVTMKQGNPRVIKGAIAADAEIWKSMKSRPEWQRVVAFRLNQDENM